MYKKLAEKRNERVQPMEQCLDSSNSETDQFCAIKNIPQLIENSNEQKVYFDTVGIVCRIEMIPYKIFLYEAIVLAVKNASIPLLQPSTSSCEKVFNMKQCVNPKYSSIGSTTFTTSSNFLLVLCCTPIINCIKGGNVQIGTAIACKDLWVPKGNTSSCEMLHCFATGKSQFLNEVEATLNLHNQLLELLADITNIHEYLTQCSMPVSILLLDGYITKAMLRDTTKKTEKTRKRKSADTEEVEVEAEVDVEMQQLQLLNAPQRIGNAFQPFKPLFPKKD